MTPRRENGAAAKTEPEGSVAPPAAADFGALGAPGLQEAIADLVKLATDVLRALGGGDPARIEAATGIRLDVAARAEPQIRALRGLLQDYADGVERVADGDEQVRRAASALRTLLEIVTGVGLPLPGEGERPQPATLDDFDSAVAEAGVAVAPAPAPESDQTWTVTNLTAHPLRLRGRDGTEWVLPAYGSRTIDVDPHAHLDLRHERARGEVDVSGPRPKSTPTQYDSLALYVWLVPGAIAAGNIWGTWGWIGGAIAFLAPIGYILLAGKGERWERLWGMVSELPVWLVQVVTFLIVLAVGVVVPAATIVFGADLREVVRHVVARDATADEYLTLVCRTMQLALISIASLLPALLYYQFDRDRLSTLREKFVYQIFRLDSSMTTMGAIDAKYGRLIDEIYGPERSGRYRRLTSGRRAPIFVATLLIMLGWLLVLLNPDVGLVTDEAAIAQLFEPRQSAPAFAFLGAYFFTLFALLRGYVRRDLQPKSYSDISVRIIAVVILAWVLELGLVDDSEGLLALAFLTGIVPQAALNRIRELSQRRLPRLVRRRRDGAHGADGERSPDPVAAALADPLPLTELEGIDLYDRTRLASEGVTNIEALAHHDLVELMLLTRIPVPRLVDWTDQAILHLHVDAGDRATLLRYGIRTASDLLRARDRAESVDDFFGILDGDQQGKPRRMQVIVDAMADDEWMESIRSWHGAVAKQSGEHASVQR